MNFGRIPWAVNQKGFCLRNDNSVLTPHVHARGPATVNGLLTPVLQALWSRNVDFKAEPR
jgi:hypothetical protein